MHQHSTLRNLHNNSRFYILVWAVLGSIGIACWLRLRLPGDQVYYIRTEQTFGLVSICLWYVALVLSPLHRVVGDRAWMKHLLFARRAIGVSAAYFALLHTSISLWGQLGGLDGIALLPPLFKWALGLGVLALLQLSIMAGTSFDKVVAFFTYPRWKIIHRFSYPAGVLVILHVWLIGTHAASLAVTLAGFVALAFLFGLEAIRGGQTLAKKFASARAYRLELTVALWVAALSLLAAMPLAVSNYHSRKHSTVHGVYHE
ncbi:MAG TPA: ferric reductase-like transmembrane domain-containing protein [Nevskiaceae bacterium]|nr:ferric reductase-like transmembrane domain-containing protein [Nevskiaceae bacterium]